MVGPELEKAAEVPHEGQRLVDPVPLLLEVFVVVLVTSFHHL